MSQYNKFKNMYPDFVLLFQLGDFYEMFNADAEKANQLLDLTLTKRRNSTPMCGIPVRSLDTYIERFLKRGVMVAVCEQVGDIARKGKVLRREITRLITPGTVVEDKFLGLRSNNYLLAIHMPPSLPAKNNTEAFLDTEVGMAWTDLSTGELFLSTTKVHFIESDLARLSPGEIITDKEYVEYFRKTLPSYHISARHRDPFDSSSLPQMLATIFPTVYPANPIHYQPSEMCALSGLLDYVKETQQGKLVHFTLPQRYTRDQSMFIDSGTRASLELNTSLSRNPGSASVLSVIDKTLTGPGGRLLAQRLNAPEVSIAALT